MKQHGLKKRKSYRMLQNAAMDAASAWRMWPSICLTTGRLLQGKAKRGKR